MFAAELVVTVAVFAFPARDVPAAPSAAPHADVPPAVVTVGDRTVHLHSLGGPAADHLLSRIAADIGAAIDAVVAFWGPDWSRDVVVVAAGTRDQFLSAAGGPASQWEDIAAVTLVESVDPVSRRVAGQRIMFAPEAGRMHAGALRIVLRHELFHYAARADTALDAPRWLTEGVADFVARPVEQVPAGVVRSTMALPSDADLDTPGEQRSLAYDRSWLFARFVADVYGPDKLRGLYLAACGVGHTDLPPALRSVLGIGADEVLERWREWLGR
ncbi:hypothetical protein [Mycobacterium intermedium]|uniref:hypothetical protein n=1 Tax=Mycobacterium intermedium TaxID=28445 RepID=UPI000A50141F